jgi:hypothetical protein
MSYHDSGTSWFLAQFKPNSHRIAERTLLRQGFRIFLPLHEETTRIRGKFTVQMRPLFPGYLFVVLNLLQAPGARSTPPTASRGSPALAMSRRLSRLIWSAS